MLYGARDRAGEVAHPFESPPGHRSPLRSIEVSCYRPDGFLCAGLTEEVNSMKRLAARLVCMFLILPLPASAVDTSILGTWRLQSFVREVIATARRYNEFGEKPDGYISYLPDGRMHAILTIDDRMRPGGPVPTNLEKVKIGTTIEIGRAHV